MSKVVLITGATSGIGRATAELLVEKGYIVYGSVRKADDLAKDSKIKAVVIDMTDYKSLEKAVTKIIKEQGRIDVLFNNAGFGQYGSVEETTIDAGKYQFDVNLFGLARLTQLVLPHMRKQKAGLIVNTSSIGGKIYTPLGAWYHATKHALEGWSDCLRIEVAQFDINVVIVEPGPIASPWVSGTLRKIKDVSGSGSYKKYATQTSKSIERAYRKSNTSPPSVVAHVVLKAIKASKPKTRYPAGKRASLIMTTRKYLSDRMFDKIVSPKI